MSRFLFLLAASGAIAPAGRAGTGLKLDIDAREASRRIIHAHEILDVKPGPLTLSYAEWIPGEHGPTGPVVDLVGLKMSTGGPDDTVISIPWRRDLANMYLLHCDIPVGWTSIWPLTSKDQRI